MNFEQIGLLTVLAVVFIVLPWWLIGNAIERRQQRRAAAADAAAMRERAENMEQLGQDLVDRPAPSRSPSRSLAPAGARHESPIRTSPGRPWPGDPADPPAAGVGQSPVTYWSAPGRSLADRGPTIYRGSLTSRYRRSNSRISSTCAHKSSTSTART